MAEALKHMYNPAFFEQFCAVLKKEFPHVNERGFVYSVFDEQWPDLELKQRMRHITHALHKVLNDDFAKASDELIRLARRLRKEGIREQGFALIFLADYIEVYGLDYFQASMKAIEEVTKLVSAEFAIRPFIIRYPVETLKQLLAWSLHEDANVRRLSPEGCRLRLPWAMGIPALKQDPSLILPILENLKCDPSEYVRRSVANNLNDIAKDHPALTLSIVQRWKGTCAETDWIIRHGCRSLLKKGNQDALSLHGINHRAKAEIPSLKLLKNAVRIGEALDFEFTFVSKEKRSATFRIDYAIDYITSSGKKSTKIFKITEGAFDLRSKAMFKKKQSFKDLTTRKHFKGKHTLSILVNGHKLASKDFMVA